MKRIRFCAVLSVLRAQIPEQLKSIKLYDNVGNPEFFISNTVDESCTRNSSSLCYDDCHYITDKSDYYTELKCRFCLIRWKCLDQSELRKCGRSRCSQSCQKQTVSTPKIQYGLSSVWRSKECLACLLQEDCATEYDLKMHYGFTLNCVNACVSEHRNSCPPLHVADKCSTKCHDRCGMTNDPTCFTRCLKDDDCPGMTNVCIDCIELCAATKVVVEETHDRSLFDIPQMKAHFSSSYMEKHNLVSSVPEVGRFRDEKKKKKHKNKGNSKQPKEHNKKKQRRDRRKNKKYNENGKKIGSKRQQKQQRKENKKG